MKAASLDRMGAGVSGLCLVHCLALPLVSSGLPALANLAEAEWVHIVILVLAAPIAVGSLLMPSRGSRTSPAVAGLGGAGLLMLTLGVLGPAEVEPWANVAGGLALGSAHLANWRDRHRSVEPCKRTD